MSEHSAENDAAEKDAAFRTPTEALEHLVIMLERGERVPFWAITEARAVLDEFRLIPGGGTDV